MESNIGGYFVQQVRRELTLCRESTNPERQTKTDRLSLTLSGWAHFYFNYRFAPKFDTHLDELCKLTEAEIFRLALLELFELHYLSSLMSFNTSGFRDSDIQQQHFSDMQYGYHSVATADGSTPAEIIDNAQHEMLYHDITYSWSTRPLLGPLSSYYSANALLYQIKRQLHEQLKSKEL